MTIGRKLGVVLGIILSFTVFVVTVTVYFSNYASSQVQRNTKSYTELQESSRALEQLNEIVGSYHYSVILTMMGSDKSKINKEISQMQNGLSGLAEFFIYREKSEHKKQLEELKSAIDDGLKEVAAANSYGASELFEKKIADKITVQKEHLLKIKEERQKSAEQVALEIQQTIVQLGYLIVAVLLVGVIGFIWFVSRLRSNIVGNLQKITAVAEKISGGDYDQKMTLESHDEIGIMASALNQMAEKTSEQIANNKKIIEEMASFVQDVEARVEQQISLISEIKEASARVSDGVLAQSTASEEIQESLRQFRELLTQSTKTVRETEGLARSVDQLVDTELREMGNTKELMNDIHRATQNIIGFVKSIDDIAFQTNLLSLNASVEAARAGTSGKGFAVVAEEVRNLAHRSSTVTAEVRESVGHAVAKVGSGLAQTERSATGLKGMTEKMRMEFVAIQQITQNTEHQTEKMKTVSSGLDTIVQVVSDNRSASEIMGFRASDLQDHIKMLRQELYSFAEMQKNKANGDKSRGDQNQNRFEWQEQLDIGVEKMNEDHKKILGYMNQLYRAYAAKKPCSEQLQILERFAEFVVQHFKQEENYMASIGYLELDHHRKIHEKLLNRVGKYIADIKEKQAIPADFFSFLIAWLMSHIMDVDMQYGPKKRGQRRNAG